MNSDWERCHLNKLVLLQRGHDLSTSKRGKGNIPVAGSNGIVGFHDKSKGIVPGVTIGRSGSIGNTQFFDSEYFPLNTTLYVTDFLGNYPKFVYYFFKRFDFSAFDSGSVQPSLNRNFLYTAIIDKPGLADQKAIAHILGTLDDKIELNRKINVTLEEIAKALFKTWFINFDPLKTKAANLSTELSEEISYLFPNSFAETKLGYIPKGWRVCKLKDIFNIKKGSTPSTKNKEFWDPGIFDWVTPRDLSKSSEIHFSNSRKISELGLNKIKSGLLPSGSVLFSSRAPIGLLGIANREISIGTGIFGILPCSEMSSGLIYLYLQQTIKNLKQLSIGTTFEEISLKIFGDHEIVIPEEKLLKRTKNIFDSIFEKIRINTSEINKLSLLKEFLLPKLISGELKIPDAEKLIEEVEI